MAPTATCKAVNCSHNQREHKDIAFHKFPSNNPQTLAIWIKACQQEEAFSTKCSVLCEDHFVPTDYAGYANNKPVKRKILKRGAVPSRNLPGAKPTLVNQATKFHTPELQTGTPKSGTCDSCKTVQTQFYCGKCQVNLCLQPCFKVILRRCKPYLFF